MISIFLSKGDSQDRRDSWEKRYRDEVGKIAGALSAKLGKRRAAYIETKLKMFSNLTDWIPSVGSVGIFHGPELSGYVRLPLCTGDFHLLFERFCLTPLYRWFVLKDRYYLLTLSASEPFHKLKCKSILRDNVIVSNDLEKLTSQWKIRGSARFLPLLRQFAPKETPDSLLKAYDFLNVTVEYPIDQCAFDSDQSAKFQCSSKENIKVKLEAKMGAWEGHPEETVDYYGGLIRDGKLASQFSKKHESRVVAFVLSGREEKNKFSVETTNFFAQYTSSEGPRDPECLVDSEFVIGN